MCKNLVFNCKNCGSSKLSYQKFVKCITPIEIKEDKTVFYKSSKIDEDDYLVTSNGFCCADCNHLIDHCGCHLETEKELVNYLTLDPVLRDQQEQDYHAYIDAQGSTQEQRAKEQAFYDQQVAETVEMEI